MDYKVGEDVLLVPTGHESGKKYFGILGQVYRADPRSAWIEYTVRFTDPNSGKVRTVSGFTSRDLIHPSKASTERIYKLADRATRAVLSSELWTRIYESVDKEFPELDYNTRRLIAGTAYDNLTDEGRDL